MSDAKKPTSIVIGPGRMSYPHLLKAQKHEDGRETYSVNLLLPPSYDINHIIKALRAAWIDKFGTDKDKWPKGPTVRTPDMVVRMAEDVTNAKTNARTYPPEFDGWFVVAASCQADSPPGIVDGNLDDVSDPRAVYPGRWARISVNAYGYSNKTRGVTLGLNNVQLLRNDKPLAGKAPAKADFDAVAEEMGAEAGDGW
jgi:hypothetical protein